LRRTLPLALSTLGVVLLASAASVAQRRGPATIGIDELRPGMRGYGLSVFRGTVPERFDVEVIDVLHGFRPDQALILVRTPHPLLDRARVVGGMSGSPIFFDGRLAGAYAYGWPNGEDPVVGVTPIRNMLAELHRPTLPDVFPGARPFTPRPSPARRGPDQVRADASGPSVDASRDAIARSVPLLFPARGTSGTLPDAFTALTAHTSQLAQTTPLGLVPTSTPVMLGGFTDEVAHLLAEKLGPLGLVPMQAGGTGAAEASAESPAMVPGGAMAVSLVSGDMSTSAIGTVTHVDPGGRLVAFGHPMINQGQMGLPAAAARILHVFVSNERSMKIGEALGTIGTLIHDRQSGIVIDTQLRPATVPMTMRLHGVPGAPRDTWHVELASHRALTPVLAYASLQNAIKATVADQLPLRWRAVTRVTIEGLGPIEVTDVGASDEGPGNTTPFQSLRMFALMEAAFGNDFVESRVTDLDVDLSFEFGHHVVEVVSASVSDGEVDPGETVPLTVVLRRFGEPDEARVLPVRIPEDAAGRRVTLKLRPAPQVPRERGEARSLADLVQFVLDAPPPTSLAVSIELESRGLRFPGRAVRSLPPSALAALHQVHSTEAGQAFVTHEDSFHAIGDVVEGTAELEVQVRATPRSR
jgi:hypothetical protein